MNIIMNISPGLLDSSNDYDFLYKGNIPFITIMSSLLFVINAILAYYKNYYLYAGFFAFLTLTSIIYRFMPSIYTYILDKLAIGLIIGYGAYLLYQYANTISKTYIALIIATFIGTIILYCYGYSNKCFCFDNDFHISEKYMVLVHTFSCLGHSMIIFM
jgi:hypothetical protein